MPTSIDDEEKRRKKDSRRDKALARVAIENPYIKEIIDDAADRPEEVRFNLCCEFISRLSWMQSKLCAVYCHVKQSFWNLQWKETVGDESREFGRYMRQREEQEKQEEESFTRAPVTKRDKQIEKRIRRQLHGYVKIVYLLLLLIVCVNTQLTLVSYEYYLALGLPFGIFSLS
jgi:U3 small nucleolar ribonucleoprotein protein LCP5